MTTRETARRRARTDVRRSALLIVIVGAITVGYIAGGAAEREAQSSRDRTEIIVTKDSRNGHGTVTSG